MVSSSQLDHKINAFMARKEEEIPELKESVEVLYHDLTSPHLANHFHLFQREDAHKRTVRHLRTSRIQGLSYAA